MASLCRATYAPQTRKNTVATNVMERFFSDPMDALTLLIVRGKANEASY